MSQLFFNATLYQRNGWAVIPLRPRMKMPYLHWKQGQSRAMSAAEIETFWRMAPDANVGLICGAVSGFFVLDCDSWQAIDEVTARGLPRTLTTRTASGMHFYFKLPDFRVGNRAKFLTGCDIRGDGGYVVAPPSIHPSGKRYEWQGLAASGSIVAAPNWLLDILRPSPLPKVIAAPPAPAKYSYYARIAFDNEIRRLTFAGAGERNNQLNRSAYCLGQLVADGALRRGDVEDALRDVALSIGLSERETEATIASGLNAGIKNPRSNRTNHG